MRKPHVLTKQAEIKPLREKMHREQKGIDPITRKPLSIKDGVLDHCHNTQKVRKVIHRQINAALGKIENAYKRYVKPVHPDVTLQVFLQGCIDYLNAPQSDYLHPKWINKASSKFNTLNESQKDGLLERWGLPKGKNSTERLATFRKVLNTAVYDFDYVLAEIKIIKEKT